MSGTDELCDDREVGSSDGDAEGDEHKAEPMLSCTKVYSAVETAKSFLCTTLVSISEYFDLGTGICFT
jgi:hypothetical protein